MKSGKANLSRRLELALFIKCYHLPSGQSTKRVGYNVYLSDFPPYSTLFRTRIMLMNKSRGQASRPGREAKFAVYEWLINGRKVKIEISALKV